MTQPAKGRILVVDDNPDMTRVLADQLSDVGYEVQLAGGGAAALETLRQTPFDMVITDLRMEGVDGFDVLKHVREEHPQVPVLIMTAFGAIDSAVEAMRLGAYHFFTKPFQLEEVLLNVERALSEQRLRDENRALLRLAGEQASFASMVGRSAPMRALFALIERAAQAQAPVLVRGESGSGKELVARALHFSGPRRERPFVALNCASLPEALLESELFGHTRGAFTGANVSRRGLFLEADGGTLFLDEIAEMAPGLQAKLLRVLEDGEVRSVGADLSRKVDVRIVCATNRDLERLVTEGRFRADLFYRLNVVLVEVPPLRARTEDIPPLVEHFLMQARRRNPNARITRFAPAAVAALARSAWPGNVRQLENLIERLAVVCLDEEVGVETLQELAPTALAGPSPIEEARETLPSLRQLEDDYIAWVIARCGGNKSRAAEILGIDKATIHRREKDKGAR